MEIQASENGQVSTLVDKYDTQNEADNKYHTILAAASISEVYIHSAVILTEKGRLVKSETYKHEAEVEETIEE